MPAESPSNQALIFRKEEQSQLVHVYYSHGRGHASHIGHMYQEIDGYYVFAFDDDGTRGFLSEDFFLGMAHKLMEMNREWDAVVRSDRTINQPPALHHQLPPMNLTDKPHAEETMQQLVAVMSTLPVHELEKFVKAGIELKALMQRHGPAASLSMAYTLCSEVLCASY